MSKHKGHVVLRCELTPQPAVVIYRELGYRFISTREMELHGKSCTIRGSRDLCLWHPESWDKGSDSGQPLKQKAAPLFMCWLLAPEPLCSHMLLSHTSIILIHGVFTHHGFTMDPAVKNKLLDAHLCGKAAWLAPIKIFLKEKTNREGEWKTCICECVC